MAHPTIKWEDNKEYSCEMLGGPYGPADEEGNSTIGPIPNKFREGELQWKYLINVDGKAHYWYATDRANEMIEKRGYNTPKAPFTLLKRVSDGRNRGFELSGETYDVIFPVKQEDAEPQKPDPLTPDQQTTLDEYAQQGPPADTPGVIARLDKIGGMVKEIKEDIVWIRRNTTPF